MPTLRKSVIDSEEPTNIPRPRDRRNDVADTFSKLIDQNLGELILPRTFGSSFNPEEAELYVSRRKWVLPDKSPEDNLAYEYFLHKHICPCVADDTPLVLIIGAEGVGKSTLVRYYFDCYLRNFVRFAPKHNKRDIELTKKGMTDWVVLYTNLKRSLNTNATEKKIFGDFSTQIRKRFPDISREDQYAMWHRIAHWDEPHHKDGESDFVDRNAYRRHFVDKWIMDEKSFVEEALWYLGQKRDNQGKRLYYLTVILDDLDQQFDSTQLFVVKMVLEWLGDKVLQNATNLQGNDNLDLWKVLIPLRPETLLSLISLQPIDKKKTIYIGEVDQQLLLECRINKLENTIRDSHYLVESDTTRNSSIVFLPLTSGTAAKRLKQMLLFDYKIENNETARKLKPGEFTRDFLENFCNESIRRFLRLRKRMCASITMERAIRRLTAKRPAESGLLIPHYVFMDSVLTGGRDHFDAQDIDNDVLNVFNTTQAYPSAYSMMIGLHVLYLVNKHRYTRDELINDLRQIGYREVEILECIDSVYIRQIIKFTHDAATGGNTVYPEKKIITAYLFLATDNAYIDNMALVTPVSPDNRKNMNLTVSYERKEFMARVRTSFAFLRQIRDDEIRISTWISESDRHDMPFEIFKRDFNSLGLPCFYRKMAIKYREAIERLRDIPHALVGIMRPNSWQELLNDNILKVGTQSDQKYLTAIRGPD